MKHIGDITKIDGSTIPVVDVICIAVCKKHFGDEDAGIEGDVKEYL